MNKTVLLVEDFADDVFWMLRAWKKEGLTASLQVVNDGRMALEYLTGKGKYADREKHPTPSLILLDLKLPYIMGLDVLKWMRDRQEFRTLPVIILTTSALQQDVDDAYHRGANGFLVKPSSGLKLGEVVRPIRDFWLTANLLPSAAGGDLDGTGPAARQMEIGETAPRNGTEARPR
jgi:CheY-like chemotaxis protein